MIKKNDAPLRRLVNKLFFSFCLALSGSWALIVSRINLGLLDDALARKALGQFYLDLGGLSLFLLGLFMGLYYRLRLTPRLRRIEELGMDRW
ncbi:MAG: hypothetical protein LBP33_06900 [Candidatus Adiutrix sp.]|jgi:hypothetical protein|nr:hypothetical protein [Candidatus Adiutrix sp.]